MENLTEKVLRYQKTRRGRAEIIAALAQRIYQFPRHAMGWDEDACGEFYLFFHPRLVRLLDRFRDQGKPFESYLCAVLTWQLRNFARDRKRLERSWSTALRIEPGPAFSPGPEAVADPGAAPLADLRRVASIVKSAPDRRNLLFLILKCARTLEPQHIAPLARVAGVPARRLAELSIDLCRLRAPRDARLEALRQRRNRAFSQARLLEAELFHETDAERRAALFSRISRFRKRMRQAMARMARVGLAPTNREIAQALGVPKGTVDSGLFWLKKKLRAVYDPQSSRSA